MEKNQDIPKKEIIEITKNNDGTFKIHCVGHYLINVSKYVKQKNYISFYVEIEKFNSYVGILTRKNKIIKEIEED